MSRKLTIDTDALYAALDLVRRERGISMRQLAKEIGVSPSLLSRLANGYKPDADGLVTLTSFLRMPVEQFIDRGNEELLDNLPELSAQMAPLLRARPDFDADDVEHLEEVIDATVRLMKAVRAKR
ncbi:helix-turn-helix domain-containing protein [Gordonia oryzae]|uniref:helix-turn-helix domain-containing protein n=1 Tax=Gordonia oryzae TaxID=2487349 RepID=UPI002482E2F5|nr:helix-turn-helix transcriptional regulator [Gordonia oryzae]